MNTGRALSLLATAILLSAATVGCAKKSTSRTTVQITAPAAAGTASLHTAIAVIEGEKTLGRAIDELDLEKQWALTREQCIGKIREGLKVTTIKGTDLLQISIADTDPDLAAEIANSIAKNYRELIEESDSDTKVVIHELAKPATH